MKAAFIIWFINVLLFCLQITISANRSDSYLWSNFEMFFLLANITCGVIAFIVGIILYFQDQIKKKKEKPAELVDIDKVHNRNAIIALLIFFIIGMWFYFNPNNTSNISSSPIINSDFVKTEPINQFVNTESDQNSTNTNPRYVCNCSKTCSQMNSCDEAQYQLNVCGCGQRDADHDGIACDAQCQ